MVFSTIESFEYALARFGATATLGLLSHIGGMLKPSTEWSRNHKPVSSRLAKPSLPVLDFRALSDDQLLMAELIFDEFRDKELQPAYLADADPNRALLDRRVIRDLLNFDETNLR